MFAKATVAGVSFAWSEISSKILAAKRDLKCVETCVSPCKRLRRAWRDGSPASQVCRLWTDPVAGEGCDSFGHSFVFSLCANSPKLSAVSVSLILSFFFCLSHSLWKCLLLDLFLKQLGKVYSTFFKSLFRCLFLSIFLWPVINFFVDFLSFFFPPLFFFLVVVYIVLWMYVCVWASMCLRDGWSNRPFRLIICGSTVTNPESFCDEAECGKIISHKLEMTKAWVC